MSKLIVSPVEQLVQKGSEQLVYIAHLNRLLMEACLILENLDVSVDVSEHLAHWWEHHKQTTERPVENPVANQQPILVRTGVDDFGCSGNYGGSSSEDEDIVPPLRAPRTSF